MVTVATAELADVAALDVVLGADMDDALVATLAECIWRLGLRSARCST